MKKLRKNNKGFSLVELIVVIAIMAVLVGVLAPQFMGYVEKSREATDIQNLDSMRTQVEAYCADHETVTSVTLTIVDSTASPAITSAQAVATVSSGTAPTSADIIGTSHGTAPKSSRITTLSATFTVASNTWSYTLAGTNLFYDVDATTGEIVAN